MSKVVVIGIDGMDSIQLSNFEDYLPNFSKLKKCSPDISLSSVFPPDSIPAWGSIYTGLNPAEHGIINFLEIKNKNENFDFKELHSYYRGKTFWDKASDLGKKVCILLPYSIYPPWQVNGVMICRTLEVVSESYPLKAYPEYIFEEYELFKYNVNLYHGFPSRRDLDGFLNMCLNRTRTEGQLALQFLKNYESDLYFVYFSALDAIQHTFWSYYDKKHPDYPGPNKYENVIFEFYKLMDYILGNLLKCIGDDTCVILLSDHGHGMRPVKLVNMNELLRNMGYLVLKEEKNKLSKHLIKKEKIKKYVVNFINHVGVGNFSLKLVDKFPVIRNTISGQSYIDEKNTIAYVSAISGVKSYSEGGLIMKNDLPKEDYDKYRDEIIKKLENIEDPISKEKLINWIGKREDLYEGKHIDRYPDIVFELKEDYGVGWDVKCSYVGNSSMSKFQPGSHKRYSPVLYIYNGKSDNLVNKTYSLIDIFQIILGNLNA